MSKKEKFFTIGEFAKLFNISKQTLFYYEKNKIFIPNFIDGNGYRYYSFAQYFIFEIIITLRKLDIPLQKIADYVNNRSIAELQKIFSAKSTQYSQQIKLLERNKQNLQFKIELLEQIKHYKIDKITLENCPQEYLVVNTFPSNQTSMKQQIKAIAKHNLPFSTSHVLNEYSMGYIIKQEHLRENNTRNISQIFTKVSQPEEYDEVFTKPAGLYTIIITPKGYHSKYKDKITKLMDFIVLNGLEIIGDCYITHLHNYWSTINAEEYVTQIAIAVDYQD